MKRTVRRHTVMVALGAFAWAAAGSVAAPPLGSAAGTDAVAIVDRIDRLLRGESSEGVITMSVVTRRWTRTLTMRVWSQGTEQALVKVTAPPREAGTATLKSGDDIWNYLPKIDRTIRIPTSMMMASWMGSHFTNDDLVKESRLVRDYEIQISFEGDRQGTQVWEFTLTPRPDAAVVWGQIVMEVRRDDLMPTWARYYGEDRALRRTLTWSAYQVMGDRLVPTTLTVVPADKPDESTVIEYEALRFDIPIPPDTFTLAALRR